MLVVQHSASPSLLTIWQAESSSAAGEAHLATLPLRSIIGLMRPPLQVRQEMVEACKGASLDPDTSQRISHLLLTLADVHGVLIKLADRLAALQNAAPGSPGLEHSAKEALEVFAPIANRLGVWSIKAALEDLAFQVPGCSTVLAVAWRMCMALEEICVHGDYDFQAGTHHLGANVHISRSLRCRGHSAALCLRHAVPAFWTAEAVGHITITTARRMNQPRPID